MAHVAGICLGEPRIVGVDMVQARMPFLEPLEHRVMFSTPPVAAQAAHVHRHPLPGLFVQPLSGVPFRNWAITNYVDLNPKPRHYRDFMGGTYTYDGHTGIDMPVSSFAVSDSGVAVHSVAYGQVVAVHDGEDDRQSSRGTRPANFVSVDLGNGYTALYYHLRARSVGVTVGQVVQEGQVLGLVGSSGDSSDPHLHFELDYHGRPLETYQHPAAFWRDPVPYAGRVRSVLDAGITSYDPAAELARDERPVDVTKFAAHGHRQRVTFWADVRGVRAGDRFVYKLFGPDGRVHQRLAVRERAARHATPQFSFLLPHHPDVGKWRVIVTANEHLLVSRTFAVTAAGAPALRLDAALEGAKPGIPVTAGRTTPYDFGTANEGAAPTPRTLLLTNVGSARLRIGRVTVPPGFRLAQPPPAELAPGAVATLRIEMSADSPGRKFGWVVVRSNATNATRYRFAVWGEVEPSSLTLAAVSVYTRDAAASVLDSDPGVFVVARTMPLSAALTVRYAISGTATPGTDYAAIAGSITLPAGDRAASVIITPSLLGRESNATSRTVRLTLLSASGYAVNPEYSNAEVTIQDVPFPRGR